MFVTVANTTAGLAVTTLLSGSNQLGVTQPAAV
jgi:hypothetical protein